MKRNIPLCHPTQETIFHKRTSILQTQTISYTGNTVVNEKKLEEKSTKLNALSIFEDILQDISTQKTWKWVTLIFVSFSPLLDRVFPEWILAPNKQHQSGSNYVWGVQLYPQPGLRNSALFSSLLKNEHFSFGILK